MLCCHYMTTWYTMYSKCICRFLLVSAVPVCHRSIRTLLLYSCIYSWLYYLVMEELQTTNSTNATVSVNVEWQAHLRMGSFCLHIDFFVHLGCVLVLCFAVCCLCCCCCGCAGETEYRLVAWAIAWPWLALLHNMPALLLFDWFAGRLAHSEAIVVLCSADILKQTDWRWTILLLIESGWKSATVPLSS